MEELEAIGFSDICRDDFEPQVSGVCGLQDYRNHRLYTDEL